MMRQAYFESMPVSQICRQPAVENLGFATRISAMSESTNEKQKNQQEEPNPVWFKPVMFGFMLLGLIWIITYYVTSAQYPLGTGTPWNLENWNILIGFGISMVGFMMSTRWK
jgi:hypothetical protein